MIHILPTKVPTEQIVFHSTTSANLYRLFIETKLLKPKKKSSINAEPEAII